MQTFNKYIVSIAMLVSLLVVPAGLLIGNASAANANCSKSSSGFLGFPTWYKYLTFTEGSDDCDITFDITKDVGKILLAVFEILLRLSGIIAVGFIIYGGFQYLISQGEPDKLKGAQSTITNALIGLVIAVSATAIVNLVAGSIV